ncbi:MAG: glycosyltransferase [Candidatus Aminicenantes bacterium]|nr:glycosyltransferase [Candidatus Aminicenantes bacterium]
MKIAYFSPLNPVKSGISDYSEEMLPFLASYFEIDIYIDKHWKPENKQIKDHFPIIPYDSQSFDPSQYDEIVYHMGNDYHAHKYIYESLLQNPGVVVLHDFALQGFYAERYDETNDFESYRDLLVHYYKDTGQQIAEQIRLKLPEHIWESEKAIHYPLNEEVLNSAKAVIVHSDFVKKKVSEEVRKPIITINHHGHIRKQFDVRKTRRQLGVREDEILLCSAGFINKNKRYDSILSALLEIREFGFKYVIAGEDRGHLLDHYFKGSEADIMILGHLPIERLEEVISAADICINLRHPTMGESSGSLIRMMGYGKPTLVSDNGSYAEFPDYCAIKVSPDIDEKEMIKRSLTALALDPDFRLSVGREAQTYIDENCDIKKCAQEYAEFIKSFPNQKD